MSPPDSPGRLRFDSFEIDLRTGELRKDGRVVKLQDQPMKLLTLLASRPGELVTRTEIEKALWGEEEFVEFEHGINTAMRKIREALGDDLEKPRFIETLPRKGYRFIAPVEGAGGTGGDRHPLAETAPPARSLRDKIVVRGSPSASPLPTEIAVPKSESASAMPGVKPIAGSEEEFALPRPLARSLFLLIQVGYLAMYGAALYKADALEEVLGIVLFALAEWVAPIILVTAMCGIAVRLYLLAAVGLDHPASRGQFRRLFPALFVLDALWATSPLLLVRKIGFGLALGSVAALAYLPFAQRTLVQSACRNTKPTNSAATQPSA